MLDMIGHRLLSVKYNGRTISSRLKVQDDGLIWVS